MGGKSYISFKRDGIKGVIIPEGIPIPNENPFNLLIRTVNKQLKIYQAKCGIRGVNFTTKIFQKRFSLRGEIFYGTYEKSKNKYKKEDGEGYLYIVRHTHRDNKINELFKDKKVGVSYDYIKRVEQLTLGTVGIEILKIWKMNKSVVNLAEKEIHKLLKERRLVGEWFSDEDGKLLEIVDEFISSYIPKIINT